MKFRKKPVVIEAERYFIIDDIYPALIKEAICMKAHDGTYSGDHIHTLEGIHNVTNGDWIIKGVKGKFYPCKPDIFEMTYELVDQPKSGDINKNI